MLGELVQWDTSEHDWLEGRGEKLYRIAMIDDATSQLFVRFVRHDSTEENMQLLWSYLENFGRPMTFYTDKASLFQTAGKRKRDEPGVDQDRTEMPPTQMKVARLVRVVAGMESVRDCSFPLAMVPVFLVPLSMLLHLASLEKLRQAETGPLVNRAGHTASIAHPDPTSRRARTAVVRR
jgi:hypothetical protein